jgi:hypothetical protein
MGRQRSGWLGFTEYFGFLVGVATFSPSAISHDWYPPECCNGFDCAPVERTAHTQPIAGGSVPQLIVTTRHGTAVVPQNFPARDSKDHRMHACIVPIGNEQMRIICLFLPPSN